MLRLIMLRSPFKLDEPFIGVSFPGTILIDSDFVMANVDPPSAYSKHAGLNTPEQRFFFVVNHELWHSAWGIMPANKLGIAIYNRGLQWEWHPKPLFLKHLPGAAGLGVVAIVLLAIEFSIWAVALVGSMAWFAAILIPISTFLSNEAAADRHARKFPDRIDPRAWKAAEARARKIGLKFTMLPYIKRVRCCRECSDGKRVSCWKKSGAAREIPSIYASKVATAGSSGITIR